MEIQTEVEEQIYGAMPDGRQVKIFTLTNGNSVTARVMEYGAILVSLEMPDRVGKIADITLGYDHLAGWFNNSAYFGATVGRFGNRIRGGKFSLDGKSYALATNNDPGGIPCHLHGGLRGFDKVLWSGKKTQNGAVEFSYTSPEGEEGYPGQLEVKVTYALTNENELTWHSEAISNAPTIVNLIHHSYWNLSGDSATTVDDHLLQLRANEFLPTDAGLIPTGAISPVAGTPLDFTEPTPIGERIGEKFEALELAGGYDHAWVLEKATGVRLAARVKDPKSGRVMEISTNQPAIQFYSGNFLDGTFKGKAGCAYGRRSGLCLETEGFPDSPNQPAFPSPVIRPGDTYRHTMIHRFYAE